MKTRSYIWKVTSKLFSGFVMFYLDGCLQLHATFLERYISTGKKEKKKIKNKKKAGFENMNCQETLND